MKKRSLRLTNTKLIELIEENKKKQKLIYEGLIFSYPINIVVNQIVKKGFDKNDIIVEADLGKGAIFVKIKLINDFVKKIEDLNIKLTNLCGWSLAAVLHENGKKIKKDEDLSKLKEKILLLQFEPKFDVEIDINENIPPILYHMTTLSGYEKIKKTGIIPKTKSNTFSYSDRLYLCENINDLFKLANLFVITGDKKEKDINNKNGYNIKEFYIFKIKTHKIFPPIRLFVDPNYKNSYYSLEGISKDYCTPYLKISLNHNGEIIKKEKI